jgi:hypothetical protein
VSTNYLRRYTDISALVSLLTESKITLLDPKSWDDRNDRNYLDLYKKKDNLETLLALCFVQTDERYHHWSVFAAGTAGVCIRFDRARLTKSLRKRRGIRMGEVTYLTLDEMRDHKLKTAELPFLKRSAFQDEKEFRVIYESCTEARDHLDIPIRLSSITRITLSPWLPKSLSDNLKDILHSIDGCDGLSIARSTLIENEEWHRHGKTAVNMSQATKARKNISAN